MNKLENVCVIFSVPKQNWSFELQGSDGTVWTVESGLTKQRAIERAIEFSQFSGLPAYCGEEQIN